MNFSSELLAQVASSGVCGDYYSFCRRHPLRSGTPLAKISTKEVLQATAGRLPLLKLRGPGRVFQLAAPPPGVSLSFLIKGRSYVEGCIGFQLGKGEGGGSFASLCHDATIFEGTQPPNPPYPRPEFHSLEELLVVFEGYNELTQKLARFLETK